MATYTPSTYFPQGSLAPPDPKRYRRFKLLVVLICLGLVLLLGGLAVGLWFVFGSVV